MANPVNELSYCFLSAIEKYERNKKYGKQAVLDSGEMSGNSGRFPFEHGHEMYPVTALNKRKSMIECKLNLRRSKLLNIVE